MKFYSKKKISPSDEDLTLPLFDMVIWNREGFHIVDDRSSNASVDLRGYSPKRTFILAEATAFRDCNQFFQHAYGAKGLVTQHLKAQPR